MRIYEINVCQGQTYTHSYQERPPDRLVWNVNHLFSLGRTFVFKPGITRCQFKSGHIDIESLISVCPNMFISPNHTLIFVGDCLEKSKYVKTCLSIFVVVKVWCEVTYLVLLLNIGDLPLSGGKVC